MNLDTIAGALVLLIAMGLFALFEFTDIKHGNFPSAPWYVRPWIFLWGGMLMWRGADLISLADQPFARGRIDTAAMMATFALTGLVGSLVWWVTSKRLPILTWLRLGHAFKAVTAHPDLVPAVLTGHEVAEELRAAGQPTVEAGEGPDAVWREGAGRPKTR